MWVDFIKSSDLCSEHIITYMLLILRHRFARDGKSSEHGTRMVPVSDAETFVIFRKHVSDYAY